MVKEEYEGLTIAVAMIDAVVEVLEDTGTQDNAIAILYALRNDLNMDRVVCLGNGSERPFYVSDLLNT